MGASIEPVAENPAPASDTLELLQEPAAAPSENNTAVPTASVPSVATAEQESEKGKPGRKRLPGERTASGRLKKKRATTVASGRRYGRAEANAPDVSPVAGVATSTPLSAPVQDGPAPGAFVPPAPELVEFCRRPVRLFLAAGIALAVRLKLVGEEWLPKSEEELDNLTESGALVLAARMPKVAENSPEAMLVLAAGEYAVPRLVPVDGSSDATG